MININKLKELRIEIGLLIRSNLTERGTDAFYNLCHIASRLEGTIKMLEHPEDHERLKRLINKK